MEIEISKAHANEFIARQKRYNDAEKLVREESSFNETQRLWFPWQIAASTLSEMALSDTSRYDRIFGELCQLGASMKVRDGRYCIVIRS